jgi:hypothetical protein
MMVRRKVKGPAVKRGVRRFFYVWSPRSGVVHRSDAKHFVEGEKTFCGLRFRPRWTYAYGLRHVGENKFICLRCGGR